MKTIITLVLLFYASTAFAADGAFQIYNSKLSFPDGTELKTAPKDGTIIHTGNGPPPGSLAGNIGDYYVDNTNHIMYGPYSGSWGPGVYLVGPKGDTGTTGVAGPQGPAGGSIAWTWTVISGTTQAATSNNAYLTTNASKTAVTMPTTPKAGDVVRIAAASQSGGWLANANNGQIFGSDAWVVQDSGYRSWKSVASSSDGVKQVAVVGGYGQQAGQIYTSTDSGNSWIARDSDRNWNSVASSSDGTKLVAVDYGSVYPSYTGGLIYTSTDSGVTWIARETARRWTSVASSNDGVKLVAVCSDDKMIYTSTDNGVNWTPHNGGSYNWNSVASSSDGVKLMALAGDLFSTSNDSGVTWTPGNIGLYGGGTAVASSNDGVKLVAVVGGGQIYTSTDSGVTWIAREKNRNWVSVASSSDGTKLVAVVSYERIYVSSDSGVSWVAQGKAGTWSAVASSSDGTKLMATMAYDFIYSYQSNVLQLFGLAKSIAEFVYDGYGQWLIVSQTGAVTPQ